MREEDDMVARIGAHVREEQADDALFERVARGVATTAELADLERRATDDPGLARRLEASRPLGADVSARLAAHVQRGKGQQAERRERHVQVAGAPGPVQAKRRAVVAIVRSVGRYAAPLALAAALVLLLATRGGGDADSGPALPSYAVTASGEETTRGPAEPAAARLRVGRSGDARFEIVARPSTSVGGANVVVYPFAMIEGEPIALDANVQVSKDGAIRIRGPGGSLDSARELRLVVGTPESLGTFEGALERARRGAPGSPDGSVHVLLVGIDRD